MKLKNTLILTVILALVLPFSAQAVNQGFTQRLKNISSFLKSFIDADTTINYWYDSSKAKSCQQLDLMSLHAQKDDLSDQMLHEYRTLSQSDLDALKISYALLDSELTFVRKSIKLSEEELREKVIKKSNKLVSNIINENLDEWINNKYVDKIGLDGEYANCPGAWAEVAETWQGLSDNLTRIQEESKALKEQAENTTKAVVELPGSVFRNLKNTGQGIQDSFTESIQDSIDNATETLSRSAVNQDDYLEEIEAEYQARDTRLELASVLEENNSLTEIPAILSRSDADLEQSLDETVQDLSLQYLSYYQDQLTLSIWLSNQEVNDSLIATNSLFSTERTGLVDIFNTVADKQCSL